MLDNVFRELPSLGIAGLLFVMWWFERKERGRFAAGMQQALRLIGVDAKLYSDQSPLDLLLKPLTAKGNRLAPAVAKIVGEQVFKKDQ